MRIPIVAFSPTHSSVILRKCITEGAAEDVWAELCATYTSFYNDASKSTPEPSVPVPLLLRPLFRHLRTTKMEGINLLSNGAGKSFVAAIFSIACESRYTPFVVPYCAFKIHRTSGPGRGKPVLNISTCAFSGAIKWRLPTLAISSTSG